MLVANNFKRQINLNKEEQKKTHKNEAENEAVEYEEVEERKEKKLIVAFRCAAFFVIKFTFSAWLQTITF